ncbi:hypothetical protein BHE74_00001767 [Ensete ventricosum]|nr:hypothetical protein BHE74_00001767 [Ensete ventricosum]
MSKVKQKEGSGKRKARHTRNGGERAVKPTRVDGGARASSVPYGEQERGSVPRTEQWAPRPEQWSVRMKREEQWAFQSEGRNSAISPSKKEVK